MSYNQNCYFALSTETAEKAYAVGAGGYSFWDSDFTLGIEFYVLQNSKEMILFKQDQVIAIGYDSTCFYVNICGTRFTVSYSAMQPIPKVWNTVVITYDKEKALLTGYINGAKGYEKNVSETDFNISSNSYYEVAPMFYGYIRHAYCIAKCHTQAEVCNMSNLITSELNECEFAFDFTDKIPSDKGKHSLPILLSGFASVKNIVPTVDFGQLGYACPDKSSHINIGNTKSNAFTIIVNLYLNDSSDKHIVFAKEGAALDGISLSIDYSSGKPLLTYKHGTDIHEFDGDFSLYEWTNVAITFSDGFLSVYKDGTKIYEGMCSELSTDISNYAFTIGNTASVLGYKSFCGYIDYLCVFDDVKTEDQIVRYVSVVPSIYSKNAIAMFNLSNIQLYETIHGVKYSLIGNAEHVIAEDTQNMVCEPIHELGDEENTYISDYEYWQATILAEVIVEYITMNGIPVNMGYDADKKLNRSTARKLMDTIGSQYHSIELCANYQNITAELISAFIGMLLTIGAYSVIVPMFTSSKTAVDTSAGVSVMAIGGIGTFSMFFYTILKISEDRYSNLWKDLWDVPPNNQDKPTDDDKEKDAYVKISLKSIQFAHTPSDQQSSAVFLRHDYSLSDEGTPEWESDIQEKSISDALYIVNSDAKIKVRATITVSLKNQTYTGKIYVVAGSQNSGSGILGNMIPLELIANSSGGYTLDFELEKSNFNGAKIGKYFDYLSWRADNVGLFASTNHNTWILEAQPLEQWVIDRESKVSNISVKTLNILNDIRMYDASKEAGETIVLDCLDGWLKQMVHFIHDSGKFKYNYDEEMNFSYHDNIGDVFALDIRGFDSQYSNISQGTNILLSSLDSSLIIKAICALLGMNIRVTYLIGDNSAESNCFYDEEKTTYVSEAVHLYFDDVSAIGEVGASGIKLPGKYYFPCVINGDACFVYDPILTHCILVDSVNLAYDIRYLYNINFTNEKHLNDTSCIEKNNQSYRESIVVTGTKCYYSKIEFRWRFETNIKVSKKQFYTARPSRKSVRYQDGYFAFNKRDEEFDQSFKDAVGIRPAEYSILAHKVSYKYIVDTLLRSVNFLKGELISSDEFIFIIDNLLYLVYGDDYYRAGNENDRNNYDEVIRKVKYLYQLLQPLAVYSDTCVEVLNQIIKMMTMNSFFNIKIGSNRWNASIGEFIDLNCSWAITYRIDGKPYCVHCNINSEILDHLEAGENNIRLYVSNEDAYRINKILAIGKHTGIITVPKIYKRWAGSGIPMFTVSTSDQSESFDNWGGTKSERVFVYDIYDFNGYCLLRVDNRTIIWDS